ncbi:hypothetical protein [Arthrobacter sp. B10-11]|uniref:hypothetical protein n=1 Tax=Arthrobacter sp. B10-11 TaxID=3081160 RepID=UPI002955A20E|nr:hypothetical protein [Arthrobacter sp. B10-11]MDV8146848.1 hypothetical protein [Arthrobacter sp. B10-11]
MDPIKTMISATDPVRNDPSTPDGEAALRRMLADPAVFSDRLPAGGTTLEERRLRRARIAGAVTLAAAAVTAGVLAATNLGPMSSAPGPAATVTASEMPTPSPTATTTTAPTTAAAAAPSQTSAAPVLETFIFPDGHLSFDYPEGWSVRTEQGPYISEEDKTGSLFAVVLDGSGAEMARILSGGYGDGAAGSVRRTVFDHATVPGITDVSGNPAEFGFASDEVLPVAYPGMSEPTGAANSSNPIYFMDVRLAREFQLTQTTSGSNQMSLPNGIMAAYVVFDYEKQPVFATADDAKAWMASERYAQLKALLLSLKYS